MAVFSENMDRLNLEDSKGSLSKIQDYIRYMGERIDFSFRNMTKIVSAAGVSSAEYYTLLQEQVQTLAALQSMINSISGDVTMLQSTVKTISVDITALESGITALENTVNSISGDVTSLQSDVDTIQGTLSTIQSTLISLDQRITALETPASP